jgi:hypothetical protein
MNITGRILLFLAIALGGYAFFYFNIYMENGYGNLGLMDDRRNMLIVAGFAGVIGAILLVGDKRRVNEKE